MPLESLIVLIFVAIIIVMTALGNLVQPVVSSAACMQTSRAASIATDSQSLSRQERASLAT